MDACSVDLIVEFLGVVFHNILYYASVYPRFLFYTTKKYNLVNYRCLDPYVFLYIEMSLVNVTTALKRAELRRVEFVVKDENHSPVVKFVFNLERMVIFDEAADAYLVRCEQNLQTFCLLLAAVSLKFISFPAESSYEINIHTNESIEEALASLPHLEDFPLVEGDEVEEMHNIWPIRRLSIRNYNIDTYIEIPKPWTFCS